MYDEIQTTVFPKVEFIQGIPLDLDKDTFINPKMKNLIILDDLMSTASKDPRITELFTEGSHHRNLSVVAINQNLYYNKDPTQRRNCHYLILFNNPVDKLQVMTLSRQMYPENPQHLLNHFKEATSKLYGYLVVDLKPTTQEYLRLRSNVLEKSIKGCQLPQTFHLGSNLPSDQTYFVEQNMQSCDHCGLVFENIHDLQRHITRWCPENEDLPLKRRNISDDEVYPAKIHKHESEENKVYKVLMDKAQKQNESEWEEKVQKYQDKGMSEEEAKEKTDNKMKSKDVESFVHQFGQLIKYIYQLKHGEIYEQVMEDVNKLMTDGYTLTRSIRMSLNKNRHILEEMWSDDDTSDDDDEEEEEDDDGEEEDDDDETEDED